MNIVLQPYQSDLRKGRKAIIVDGVRWGVIEMDSHGVHGASYWFRQEGGEAIYEACLNFRNEPSTRMVEVWGDKHHRHDEGGAKPFPERLAERVEDLIERKLLRHPDLVRAEKAERNRIDRETRQKAEEAERARFYEQAQKALAAGTLDAIYDAMKWAQTQ